MSEIEKMKKYIQKTKLTPKAIDRYCLNSNEIGALYGSAVQNANKMFYALVLAFNYGHAKGYRAAKAEAKRE